MTLSLGLNAKNRKTGALFRATETCDGERARGGFRRYGLALVAWAALSTIWAGVVVDDVYNRARAQADMSRDVERDLDQGFIQANCTGPHCATAADGAPENWRNIASTYLRFGSVEMSECVFGPPVVLLVFGLGAAFFRSRGRRSA